jgi:lysophospholipase L1-like esterase
MNALGFGGAGLNKYAKVFIDAVENDASPTILTTAQKNTINILVKDLLEINSLQANFFNPDDLANSVLKAFYPFISNTENSAKYNLLNPVDSDAAGRLTYSSTINFTNGFKGNGSTGYANSHLNYSSFKTNNICFGYTKNETTISSSNKCPGGIVSGSYNVYPRWINNIIGGLNSVGGTDRSITRTQATDIGLYINNYRSDTSQLIIGDNIIAGAANPLLTFPSRDIFLGALNNAGSPAFYCSDNLTCWFIGLGMSDTAITALKTAIYKYIKSLNRKKRVFYFMGDSITQYYNASPQSNRFSTVLSTRCGVYEINKALAGELMCNYLTGASGHNFHDRIIANSGDNSMIDYYQDPDSILFLDHGVNEFSIDNYNLTTSMAEWEVVLDFINTTRKWPFSNIVLTGPFIKTDGNIPAQSEYNQTLKTLAEGKGCKFINVFDALNGTTGYVDTDNIHLTNAGHQFISDLIYSKLIQWGWIF